MANAVNHKKNISPNNSFQPTDGLIEELQKANRELSEARRAALNLMEDEVLAKEALQKSEARLARELQDAKQLQQISNRIIEQDDIEQLFKALLDSAIAIMNSDMGSIQIFVPEREALQLIVHKGFHPKSADIWKWVKADANSVCGISLAEKKRLVVTDIKNFELLDKGDLEAFYLSGIRAVQSTPLISRSGKIIGMLSTHWKQKYEPIERELRLIDVLARQAADVIERKKAAQALEESEERLRITMETAIDFAIINTNTKGLVEGWNSGAERTFGFKAEEIIGKSADIIFTEEDQANNVPQKEMESARENGRAEDERWHKRKDGSRLYMSGVMRPVYNPELTGYVKVARDMTEQKLIEQKKDEFIAIASHELKTPVTSIKAYTEFLNDTFTNEKDFGSADLISKLNTKVDRLTQLINSLFDTTRISAGQLQLYFEQFDVNALIEERICDLQHTTQKHRLVFTSPGEVKIVADKERIEQVLINLLSNSIKYSPRGGEVIINLEKQEAGIQVSVKDNGVGIADDVKNKIFNRFYRVNDAKMNTYPGMGLGLYISAEIIKRHKGIIWVESKLSKGSAFYFFLPYNKQSETEQ